MQVCGTPDYIAPEIIQQTGHGFPSDFWSLGVTYYEMLVGKTPFESRGGGFATYRKVMKAEFECPDTMSAGAQSLIRSLLVKDVSKRCGCLANGADDLRKHEWYTSVDFDWVKLATLEMTPPHIPKTADLADTSAFEQAPNSDSDEEEEDRADWEQENRAIDEADNEAGGGGMMSGVRMRECATETLKPTYFPDTYHPI